LDIAAHAANLLLHAANASLVAVIGSRSGLSRTDALAAGLMFATCAGLSEAVVWASGAQDVLMTTLGLMALAAVLKRDPGGFAAADPPRPRFGPSRSGSIVPIVAVIASTVALGVKETAVVVPVLGWAAAWASPGGLEDKTRRRALWLMTAVSVAYVVLRALSGVDAEYGRGLSRYFAKQLMVDPFATLGEPWSAAWIQAHPAVSLVRALTLVTLVAGAFWWWRRDEACTRCAIAFGGWVLIAVLPVLSLFHVSATLEGSRYLYLPAAGFCLLVATLAGELARRTAPRAMLPLLAGILAIFIVPSAVAIRGEGARWTRAAQIRDRILDSANDIAAVPCGTIVTEGLVDNVEGAYVFRNGLTEALAAHGRSALFGNPSAVRCRLTWSDRLVVTRVEP
jgi:hypothetical protein